VPGQSLLEQSRVVCLSLLEADDNGPRVLAETSAPRAGKEHADNLSYHRHVLLSLPAGSTDRNPTATEHGRSRSAGAGLGTPSPRSLRPSRSLRSLRSLRLEEATLSGCASREKLAGIIHHEDSKAQRALWPPFVDVGIR